MNGMETAQLCDHVRLEFAGGTEEVVRLAYHVLPGYQPRTFGNFIASWETNGMIPRSVQPTEVRPIDSDAPDGIVTFPANPGTDMLYGYSVGPDMSNICASVMVPGFPNTPAPTMVTEISSRRADRSVIVQYQTLPGYDPRQSGNWVGLWKSAVSGFPPPDPVAMEKVPTSMTAGEVVFNDVLDSPISPYAVMYFKGPKPTTAAAACAAL